MKKSIPERIAEIKAKLHAQNLLLEQAKQAIQNANERLIKSRNELKNTNL